MHLIILIAIEIVATDIQDRLFKSLLAIVILNVGGYFVNLGLMFVGLSYLPWPWSWYQFEFNGVLLNVCAAMNAPILFWMRSLIMLNIATLKD
jgi:hypothetical protein